jgi:hypothetical protein
VVTLRDESGATVVVAVGQDGGVACVKPGFSSEATPVVVAAIEAWSDGAGCVHCDVLLVEAGSLPLAVELDAPAKHRDAVKVGDSVRVRLVGFPRELRVWRDESLFRADPDERHHTMATRSLIPSGTFQLGDDPTWRPSAWALVHGEVQSAEWLGNGFGGAFARVTLASFEVDLDIVVDARRLAELPTAGSIVYADVWLTATLGGPPQLVPLEWESMSAMGGGGMTHTFTSAQAPAEVAAWFRTEFSPACETPVPGPGWDFTERTSGDGWISVRSVTVEPLPATPPPGVPVGARTLITKRTGSFRDEASAAAPPSANRRRWFRRGG